MNKHIQSLINVIVAKVDRPLVGAEIGVWKGELTAALLRRFPELTLYAVDPWDAGDAVMDRFFVQDTVLTKRTIDKAMRQLGNARQEFFKNTSFAHDRCIVLQDESSTAVKAVADNSLDFVFIDGSHLYTYVKQDIEQWLPKVKIGGLVSGHDYDGRNDRTGWFGVKRAVDEYSKNMGHELQLASWFVWYFTRTK